MKTTSVTSLLLALSIISSPLALASDEILTPTNPDEGATSYAGDDLFNDTFDDEFGAEFVDEFQLIPGEEDAPLAGNEDISEEITEDVPTEAEEKTDNRDIVTQGKIDKKISALHEKVPGAIQAKGMTFLSMNSRKFISKYLPCETSKESTLMTALTRLKLSQGAPVDCRENVTFRTFPYRMYRRTQ